MNRKEQWAKADDEITNKYLVGCSSPLACVCVCVCAEEVQNDHVLRQKCCVITLIYPHILYIVNFDGDFQG